MANPDRILSMRHVTAMAALDTMPHLTARVRNLLTHGRRMTVTQRYTYVDQPPEVTAGLTLDTQARDGGIVEGANPGEYHHFGVHLRPGIMAGFGFSAYVNDGNATEAEAWKRYHAGKSMSDVWSDRRRDMTQVDITGGLPGDGPARDDLLVIRHWNRDGVCEERVVAFDYGPDQQQRDDLARHLWVADGGSPDRWDSFNLDDEARAPFYTEVDKILAVIAGRED